MKNQKGISTRHNPSVRSEASTAGITLVALVVTIVVLIILAVISINVIFGEKGIIVQAQRSRDKQKVAEYMDKFNVAEATTGAKNTGKVTLDSFIKEVKEEGIIAESDIVKSGEKYELTTKEGYIFEARLKKENDVEIKYKSKGEELPEPEQPTPPDPKPTVSKDGSWDGTVNSPQTDGTGLIPVYYNETTGEAIELTEESTEEEWDNWYDYSTTNKRWANAITKDESGKITGYFVWIPRYAYKIESGLYTANVGPISIKFLKDDTNYDSEDNGISTTYAASGNAMTAYVVHPAFGTDKNNGGWTKNLKGFWVAKYPAGFQKNTITDKNGTLTVEISNSSDTVVNSGKQYTSYNDSYTTNALVQTLTSLPEMSLPVFKPLTYAYNNISIGDSYALSKQIASAENFYNLSNVDSHMMKNSEWGAVAYLTRSSYGITNEPNINNYYTSTSSPYKVAITGIYSNGTDTESTKTIGNMKPYYSSTGKQGSSTGNVYGVYDLNGCVLERTSGFISNGNANLLEYGKSILDEAKVTYNEAAKTVTAGTGTSNEYITIYPYNTSSDVNLDNWSKYYESRATRYGDAVLETSAGNVSTTSSWNSDHSNFPNATSPFFMRGGRYYNKSNAGVFAFSNITGHSATYHGFRVSLVS